jgi:LmbE family N-acetylglucosaminyl deacetylase
MARAKAEGHRVVLALATRGELGEYQPAALAAGESLRDRRVAETHAAAAELGVDRVAFLDYQDSGMAGESTNDAPGSFASADVEVAAERLAALLVEEHADVLTIYDDHGMYGHPDHVQVHRVGARAAELAATPRVYEATFDRDFIRGLMAENRDSALSDAPDAPDAAEMDEFGSPHALITTTVDVREYVDQKRRAMAAHASQIPADSFFLALDPDQFRVAFGQEWFIRRDRREVEEVWIFDGLAEQ